MWLCNKVTGRYRKPACHLLSLFLRVQLQRIGSPRGCSPPAGQWANLRVPPTIFHCERQGCTLCPDPAKPRLHRRAFFLLFSHSASKGRQSAAHSCIHSLLIHSQGFFLRLNKAPAQLRGCTVGAFSVFFYVLFLLFKKINIIIIINDAAFMASAVKATSFDWCSRSGDLCCYCGL